ncbi:MAG: hypothetical protein ACREKS_24585 [Candidatus Rokuibacteriota bacterium]
MAQDLRSFLDGVRRSRPNEVQIVSREVDPAYEITAIVVKLEREARRRPVLVFEKVKGSPFPVLTNLHASRSRLAAAMNASADNMLGTYLAAMERPLPPKVVSTGPVKDVIIKGDRINLYELPQIIHHEGERSGPLGAPHPTYRSNSSRYSLMRLASGASGLRARYWWKASRARSGRRCW